MDTKTYVNETNERLKKEGKPYRVCTKEQANNTKKEMVDMYKNIGK